MEDMELQIGFPKYNVLFDSKPESVNFLENFLKVNTWRRLHPNHYVLQEVKLRLIKQYSVSVRDLSLDQVLKFRAYCEDLLQTSQLIYPGYSEYRGGCWRWRWQD